MVIIKYMNIYKWINFVVCMRKQIIVSFIFMMVMMFSFSVSAINVDSRRTVVGGIVYNNRIAVPGASVTVTCNNVTKHTTSNSVTGAYSISYSSSQCTIGDSVDVIAVKDDLSGAISAPVQDFELIVNVAIANVPMTPEFGFFMGALTLLSAVGIFFVVKRD